jgi:hypothetical protein
VPITVAVTPGSGSRIPGGMGMTVVRVPVTVARARSMTVA